MQTQIKNPGETGFRLHVNGVFYGIVWLTKQDIQGTLVKTGLGLYRLKSNAFAIYQPLVSK